MPNYFVGKNRTELIDWLLQNWLKEGPPVCFVEGFSGVGKTSIARALIKNSGVKAVMVGMPEAGADQADNLFLNLATELSQIEMTDLADSVTVGKSIDKALGSILNRPVLIVIDEFQRALDESGKPTSSLIDLLTRLANRPNMPGRVLLLTNRTIDRSKWSEPYIIRTLTGLSPADAEDLLGRLLIDVGREDEIPQARRRDVVNWLGCNPRAIYVLATSLEKSSLDELIGISPEIWEARDREVSAELLHRLETELLERTIEKLLSSETVTLLRRLSVHRKAVKRDAIEKLLSKGGQFEAVRDDLINRFLMEQHSGWFSLNPVVREISLQQLREKSDDFRQAHSHAADHYMRHFKAKEIADSGKLGGYFVEARYHLVQAQREEELTQIAQRFENHLKARFHSTSPVPTQLEELNERIATLMALLETPGAKGLEFYLARLYEARGSDSDLRKALQYIQSATQSKAPVDNWILRLKLEAIFHEPLQLMLIARTAITNTSNEESAFAIYVVAGNLLLQAGRIQETIAWLQDGLAKIPADKGLHQIYQSLVRILLTTGQVEKAISVVQEGFYRMQKGSHPYLSMLEFTLLLLTSQEDVHSLDKFATEARVEADSSEGFALYKMLRLVIKRDWDAAARIAQSNAIRFSHYPTMILYSAFCHACIDELAAAREQLSSFPPDIDRSDTYYWLQAWVSMKIGDITTASNNISKIISKPIKTEEINEELLLRLWDMPSRYINHFDLAYHFPILPSSFTGLLHDVVRIPYGPSVIDKVIKTTQTKEPDLKSAVDARSDSRDAATMKPLLKVFISYSHRDEEFKDELVVMLAGLQRLGVIRAWQDRLIEAGDEWYKSIQDAMDDCDLALLLVSPDFIASRFIQDEELPRVLARREEMQLRVIPIIVRPCMWSSEPVLSELQALPKDGKPVITFSKANGERDQVWADIAKVIETRAKK